MSATISVQFKRRAIMPGGAMYLPGEIASFSEEVAQELCAPGDEPIAIFYHAATLAPDKTLDAAPLHKMVERPAHKKERNG